MAILLMIAIILCAWCLTSYYMFRETYAKGHIPDWNLLGIFLMLPAFIVIEIKSTFENWKRKK